MNGKSKQQGIGAQSTSHATDMYNKRRTQKKIRREGRKATREAMGD